MAKAFLDMSIWGKKEESGKVGKTWQGHVKLGQVGSQFLFIYFYFLQNLVMFLPPTGSELAVERIQKSFF